jgi:hypothetical protein
MRLYRPLGDPRYSLGAGIVVYALFLVSFFWLSPSRFEKFLSSHRTVLIYLPIIGLALALRGLTLGNHPKPAIHNHLKTGQ